MSKTRNRVIIVHMKRCTSNLQILTWSEVKNDVQQANSRLASLIDDVAPNDDLDFVKVNYRFGQPIIKEGKIRLPISDTETVDLDNPTISKEIRSRLDYSFVPVALLLSKKSEVCYESQDRVMPTKVFNSGSMFGLWEMFDPPPKEFVKHVWTVFAGVRSLFMGNYKGGLPFIKSKQTCVLLFTIPNFIRICSWRTGQKHYY